MVYINLENLNFPIALFKLGEFRETPATDNPELSTSLKD
jgi:hypothetical protein